MPTSRCRLREVCGAGEPLNPEVIDQVSAARGLTIRDGYGQTETTALAGNSPGQKVKVGSMGRPMPGYRVEITDIDGHLTNEGEVTLVLGADRPAGLMQGYQGDDGKLSGAEAISTAAATWCSPTTRAISPSSAAPTTSSIVGLPYQPVRAGEHFAGARSGRGGRRRAQSRSDTACDSEGLCAAGGGRGRSREPRCRSSGICIRGWRRSSVSGGSNW